jgi:modification methylase
MLLTSDGFEGSIHQAGRHYMSGSPCNGWDHWYLFDNEKFFSIDHYRNLFRKDLD